MSLVSSDFCKQPVPMHLRYWGDLAEHPEQVGLDPSDGQYLLFGHEALTQYFRVLGSERRMAKILSGDLPGDILEFALGTGCPGSELLYGSVDTWYRSLGPTNEIKDARPWLIDAANALRLAGEDQVEPADRMLTLAGDLYHEAALHCGADDAILFSEVCKQAQSCYEEVVLNSAELSSRVGLLAMFGVEGRDYSDIRAVVRATARYHDLKFLQERPSMRQAQEGGELASLEEEFLLDGLRKIQRDALRDFRASLTIAGEKERNKTAVLPVGLLRDQFVVLAARNELLTQDSPEGVHPLFATHIRNAFPREAAPYADMPHGLPSFRANVVAESYGGDYQRAGAVYYRTEVGENEQLPTGIHRLPSMGQRLRNVAKFDIPNMRLWANQMTAMVDVLPSNAGERQRIREAMAKNPLPFDVRLG